jgi:hypothetical protein
MHGAPKTKAGFALDQLLYIALNKKSEVEPATSCVRAQGLNH